MNTSRHSEHISRTEGIALLFSILLTATLLLVAIGISQISYKEGVFALEARDSERSFTAAYTGIECGLYMDANGAFSGSSTTTFSCHGSPVTVDSTGSSTFQFSLPLSANSCSQVYVDKDYSGTSTRIESYGYNVAQQVTTDPATCVSVAASTNIVTRALRTTYANPVTTGGDSGGSGGDVSP